MLITSQKTFASRVRATACSPTTTSNLHSRSLLPLPPSTHNPPPSRPPSRSSSARPLASSSTTIHRRPSTSTTAIGRRRARTRTHMCSSNPPSDAGDSFSGNGPFGPSRGEAAAGGTTSSARSHPPPPPSAAAPQPSPPPPAAAVHAPRARRSKPLRRRRSVSGDGPFGPGRGEATAGGTTVSGPYMGLGSVAATPSLQPSPPPSSFPPSRSLPFFQKVCRCLLRHGVLPLQEIVRRIEFSPGQAKNSLLVLIQHNCVQDFSSLGGGSNKTVTHYLDIFDNVLQRLCFSKFLSVICTDIPEATSNQQGKKYGCFNNLVYANYVERCPKPEPFFIHL